VNLWVRIFTQLARIPVLLVCTVFYRLRTSGVEKLPEGGVLMVSNHQSFLDPPVLQAAFRRMLIFTPRRSLHDHWLYRWMSVPMATLPINRGAADLVSIRKLVGLLKTGHVVSMFPEETRSTSGELGELRAGFHMLARRAQVPVLPVCVSGAFDIWPRQRKWPRLQGRLRVIVGEPLNVAQVSRTEAIHRVREALLQLGA
jgi:1-acyl-sn-glycerol-3-phosphate acyltransferase